MTTSASSQRLLEISDEVRRIATSLARLSAQQDWALPANNNDAPAPNVSLQTVRSFIRARRLRGRYFEEALFADPAWDMMLDLFEAELSFRRVAVSSLCIGAAVPATTALRWIGVMAEKGLLVRHNDPLDRRRAFVELSADASAAMRRFFAEAINDFII